MRNFREIDRFYIILAGTIIIIGAIVVYSIRTVFVVLNASNTIDEEIVGAADPRLNISRLDEAHKIIFERSSIPLDLKN
ncbi:hypothetical protein A2691_00745 [Candidatus Woesebacteria bacterium RIFCSPHIGHO2_01_FULL_39_23]|nr:MAG: hypothetical protein A2691_00745 [Candidatus Woesebacteria bacterium RIFCSPHIGHO2_01_FULL_39_23]